MLLAFIQTLIGATEGLGMEVSPQDLLATLEPGRGANVIQPAHITYYPEVFQAIGCQTSLVPYLTVGVQKRMA